MKLNLKKTFKFLKQKFNLLKKWDNKIALPNKWSQNNNTKIFKEERFQKWYMINVKEIKRLVQIIILKFYNNKINKLAILYK